MTVDLGRIGIWRRRDQLTPRLAKDVEELGYGAIWIGGSPPGDLFLAQELLDATDHLAVATGIVNMWADPGERGRARPTTGSPPRTPAASCSASASAIPRRRRSTAARSTRSSTTSTSSTPRACPSRTGRSPRSGRRCWRSRRSAPPGRTRTSTTPSTPASPGRSSATGPLLAPEQKVVVGTDPDAARALGRPAVDRPYLHLRNYTQQPAAARLDRRRPRRRRQRRA